MGRPLIELPTLVLLDGVPPVDVQVLVRIHGNNHLPDKGVNPAFLEPVQRRQKAEIRQRQRFRTAQAVG